MINPSEIIAWLISLLIAVGIPVLLTVLNITCCFKDKPVLEKVSALFTIFLGGFMYMLLTVLVFTLGGDWYEAAYQGEFHNYISSEYLPALFIPVVLALLAYCYLLFSRVDRRPPLAEALAVALVLIGNVINIAVALQISNNMGKAFPSTLLLYVYHFNILLLSARVVTISLKEHLKRYSGRESEMEQHGAVRRSYSTINGILRFAFPVLVALFAVICVLEIFFLISGQSLDAPIKAFTDTADWTFSKQIPPPPIEYDGHYLCTVAAGGHEKIVKPQKLGSRRGAVIVVNRQLSIANAFEEIIQEKHPKLHKSIRRFYDTHGYPLSRIITTRTRADIVYILMKPLEWLFLAYIYLMDTRPEVRINRQYQLHSSTTSSIFEQQ